MQNALNWWALESGAKTPACANVQAINSFLVNQVLYIYGSWNVWKKSKLKKKLQKRIKVKRQITQSHPPVICISIWFSDICHVCGNMINGAFRCWQDWRTEARKREATCLVENFLKKRKRVRTQWRWQEKGGFANPKCSCESCLYQCTAGHPDCQNNMESGSLWTTLVQFKSLQKQGL